MAWYQWPVPSFPPLGSNNYNQWSIQMKTFLRDQKVWDAIEVGIDVMLAAAVTLKAQTMARIRDQRALSFLRCLIDDERSYEIAEVENAKTAWEFFKKAHQSADEIAQAEARECAERAAVLRAQMSEDESDEDDEDEDDQLDSSMGNAGSDVEVLEGDFVVKSNLPEEDYDDYSLKSLFGEQVDNCEDHLPEDDFDGLKRLFGEQMDESVNDEYVDEEVEKSQAQQMAKDIMSQLESAKDTVKELRLDAIKATEASNCIASELDHSRAQVNSLEGLVEKAHQNGVKVLARTVHDTMAGIPEVQEAAQGYGIKVILGVEISTIFSLEDDPESEEPVHILPYYSSCGPTRYEEVEKFLANIRDGRFVRANNMMSKLNILRVPVKWEIVTKIAGSGTAPGRLHVARALVEAGHATNLKQTFAHYLYDDGPAYSRGSEPSAEEAVRLICDTRGLAVLAHLWSVKNPALIVRCLKEAGLHGIVRDDHEVKFLSQGIG